MTSPVKRLVALLHEAGFDLDQSSLLDALWLSLHVGRSGAAPDGASPKEMQPAKKRKGRGRDKSYQDRGAVTELTIDPSPLQTKFHSVYIPELVDAGKAASPIRIPAARALSQKLALARGLRSLRRKWPHGSPIEIDEEETVRQTAEWRGLGRSSYFPVFRPGRERWFDIEVVLEDDTAIELWQDTIREFTNMMAETGAFRRVRLWRLRLDVADPPSDVKKAYLESSTGVRVSATRFIGGARCLVLFASHGCSHHWRTGRYAQLLKMWSADAGVSLLHLLAPALWARTVLGPAHGTCRTHRPVENQASYESDWFWWSNVDHLNSQALRLPAFTLEPDALARWATLQMGMESSTPAFKLDTRLRLDAPSGIKGLSLSIEKRVNGLRENPKAYQLAAYLSVGPFTIAVAQLVMEAKFGEVDQELLGLLLLSGITRIVAEHSDRPRRLSHHTVFELDPAATALLQKSLHNTDRQRMSRDLFRAVSTHLSESMGRHATAENFTPDASGRYNLPERLEPFARFASALSGRKVEGRDATTKLEDLFRSLSPYVAGRLSRLAYLDVPLVAPWFDQEVWDSVLRAQISEIDTSGERRFQSEIRSRLIERYLAEPLWGVKILWVDDIPTNNRRFVAELNSRGAIVRECLTTDEAIELLLAESFDLVISDMGRNEYDREVQRAGFELLAHLDTRVLPVVIFAGGFASSPIRVQEAVSAGALGCTNAFNQLTELVEKALSRIIPRNASVFKEDWTNFVRNGQRYADDKLGLASDRRALSSYMIALKIAPSDTSKDDLGMINSFMSGVLKRLDRLEEAERHALRALQLSSDRMVKEDAQYNLACVYAMSGRREEMLAMLRLIASTQYMVSVIAHRETYFRSYRDDTSFIEILRKL